MRNINIGAMLVIAALTTPSDSPAQTLNELLTRQAAPPTAIGSATSISNHDKKIVITAVRSRLKDPESARFGELRASRLENGGVVVCGLVNAKNAMGGYTGEQPFVGGLDGEKFYVMAIGGTWQQSMEAFNGCAKAGLFVEERNAHWSARR